MEHLLIGNKGGRPKKYTDKFIKEIYDKIISYTEKTDLPILSEFCYLNKISKQRIYENDILSEAKDYLITKKEFMLEKLGLSGKANPTMVIFSLKQLGWKDKQEVEHTGSIKIEGKINWK